MIDAPATPAEPVFTPAQEARVQELIQQALSRHGLVLAQPCQPGTVHLAGATPMHAAGQAATAAEISQAILAAHENLRDGPPGPARTPDLLESLRRIGRSVERRPSLG